MRKTTTAYSTKLERLEELLEQSFVETDRKAILFSEWTTMLGLVEEILARLKLKYVRLDGSVPQKQRQQLVNEFQTNPDCRLFITTNAGSTGLNLQAANTVINVDLPWNPAILEQRIARAHRMGQKQPVQAYLLVTEQTMEESLLTTLSAKKDLALAALDVDSEIAEVSLVSGAEELRSRLEILLGAKPQAPLDVSQRAEVVDAQRPPGLSRPRGGGGRRIARRGVQLPRRTGLSTRSRPVPPTPDTVAGLKQRLAECVEEDHQGRQRLSITLPNRQTLDHLATTLAQLLVMKPE